MISFRYDYNQFSEVATFLLEKLGAPDEGRTWFWHNDASDHENFTEQIRIWDVRPEATFAAIKWGI